ncbi:SMP-30/gluconolactonase/LRE family protein [Sandarakinorhabdus rubra]|uniref:SMP-30/gluconolactonase/LRE family protein n=1 Tax=Sandarakinorhabdus rubra TaxID=2672568 RepID=UPI0013DB60E1|nr:SMP-30/gluconolactonase/LRE family protein [Sandarakinorhabdus rubra]
MARSITHLADGIYFGEGPRWHDGRLWFSDFHAFAVKSVDLAGHVRTELQIDDWPSGLGWLPDGSLLVVAMRSRRLLRRWPDGRITTHADLSGLAAWHTNDMVVDGEGRAYVGNFGLDLETAIHEQGFEAVIANPVGANLIRVDPDGSVHLAAPDLAFPNGSMITSDGRTLIVGESTGMRLTAFSIAADGSLQDRRVWAALPGIVPDGACLDAEGAVWLADAGAARCVRVAEGGALLDTIETDQPCYACMLGGPERRHLFMLTAPSALVSDCAPAPRGHLVVAQVDVPGAGLP